MLEVAVVGLGWWGRIIARTLADRPKLRVRRAVDPDPEARHWAEERGIAASAELADALADPVVRGVVLATPHTLHTPPIAACAGAGKHVVREKPLALRLSDAEASVRLCNAAGVVLAVGHERRSADPGIEAARRKRCARHAANRGGVLPGQVPERAPANWRVSAAEAPAGPMTATGSDLANGDTLGALATCTSGASLLLSAILATPFAGRFAVDGNRGWAELRDKAHPEAREGWVRRRGALPVVADDPASAAVRAKTEAFADAAERRAAYPVPQAEMIATIAACEAICRAAASSKVEPVARVP